MTVEVAPITGGTVSALTDAPSVLWPANLGFCYSLTLAGSRVLATPADALRGALYTLIVTQGGSGSYTLGYSSAYRIPDGSLLALSTAVGSVDIITWLFDGTYMNLVSITRNVGTPIYAATNLTASTNQHDQITLNWTNNALDATSIRIEYFFDISWSIFDTVAANVSMYVVAPVNPDSSIPFRIVTVRGVGTATSAEVTGSTPSDP